MGKSVNEIIRDKFIEDLNKGIIPWEKPWVSERAYSRNTNKDYSLLNQMGLSKGGEYLTFNQIEAEGGIRKKGAKPEIIVYYRPQVKTEIDQATGKEVEKTKLILRYYNVFHISDIEGLEPKRAISEREFVPIEEAEKAAATYINSSGIEVSHANGNKACYTPALDKISMPDKSQFKGDEEYYATLFHEMAHSTGHESRLSRDLMGLGMDKASYSKEELVAEISSAFTLANLSIESSKLRDNQQAYINGWLHAIGDDPNLIISAASKAEKATALIFYDKEKELELEDVRGEFKTAIYESAKAATSQAEFVENMKELGIETDFKVNKIKVIESVKMTDKNLNTIYDNELEDKIINAAGSYKTPANIDKKYSFSKIQEEFTRDKSHSVVSNKNDFKELVKNVNIKREGGEKHPLRAHTNEKIAKAELAKEKRFTENEQERERVQEKVS